MAQEVPRSQRFPSLLTLMSSPLRFGNGELSALGTPTRVLRNTVTPRQDTVEGDDPIASIHDLFQWATPLQNESPLRRAG
jgi:hypothetical protein